MEFLPVNYFNENKNTTYLIFVVVKYCFYVTSVKMLDCID